MDRQWKLKLLKTLSLIMSINGLIYFFGNDDTDAEITMFINVLLIGVFYDKAQQTAAKKIPPPQGFFNLQTTTTLQPRAIESIEKVPQLIIEGGEEIFDRIKATLYS